MRSAVARPILVASALILLLPSPACSLAFTSGPSGPPTPSRPPSCSQGMAAPVLDYTGAGIAIASFPFLVLAAIPDLSDDEDGGPYGLAAVGVLLGSLALGISGTIGIVRVARCRQAHREWATPAIGTERGSCRPPPGAPCNPGLTCEASHCVRRP